MIALEVDNGTLRKAIELRMNDCFPAMNIANSMGGTQSDAWQLVRTFGFDELVAEALDRGLSITEFRSSVDNKMFTDCRLYLKVRDIIGGRPDFPQ